MAAMTLAEEIAAGMQQYRVGAEARIQEFGAAWEAIYDAEERRWEEFKARTWELRDWDQQGTRVVVESSNHEPEVWIIPAASMQAIVEEFEATTQAMHNKNNERQELFGELAMYADPTYHTYVQEQAPHDQAISEAIDRMEHPPWLTEAYLHGDDLSYEDYSRPGAYMSGPWAGQEDVEYGTQHYGFEGEDLPGEPRSAIEIDTSDTDMGQRWQEQLAALDERLTAWAQEVDTMEQTQQQGKGMSW
jgi:hypothetical protein